MKFHRNQKDTPHVERFRHDYFGKEMPKGRSSPELKTKKEEKLIELEDNEQDEAADAPLIQTE